MLLDSRTRPVHQVLETYLPPDVLAYALRLWSEHYIHMKNVSMLPFVDAFYDRQPLPHSRQHIYKSLLPALMEVLDACENFDESTTELYEFPDYDLAGTPGSVTPSTPATDATQSGATQNKLVQPAPPAHRHNSVVASGQPAQQHQPVIEPEIVRDERWLIFSMFVTKLMKALPAEKRQKMLFHHRKDLTKAVPKTVAQPFYDWLMQTNTDYFEHADMDNTSMRKAVHSIYAGLCNYLGPLEADDMLVRAVNLIEDKFSRDSLDIRELL
ncbi:MAG: Unknown protein [uncultured Thiotrichaceae bacterium]|uniref:Uncharacterized protein n=1 Tax=uncultured Thiotrichaceae bacterium TaxID=298394 RepID=A0A6S6TFW4_9GAMM|nr:MAG: Unknown protein [uncultured Thiotrichaceae bacterium]